MLQPFSSSIPSLLLVAYLLLSSAVRADSHDDPSSILNTRIYSTWQGLEGDKWASAWLLKKTNPDAEIRLFKVGTRVMPGISFDVPFSAIRRTHRASSFTVLLSRLAVQDKTLLTMSQLVDDLEINAWRSSAHAYTDVIQSVLKKLDQSNGMKAAPVPCYVQFFDIIYQGLKTGQSIDIVSHLLVVLSEQPVCLLNNSR